MRKACFAFYRLTLLTESVWIFYKTIAFATRLEPRCQWPNQMRWPTHTASRFSFNLYHCVAAVDFAAAAAAEEEEEEQQEQEQE